MKRKDLEDLQLEKEVIDKIMTLNGVDAEARKADMVDLQAKLDEANKQITDFGEKVKDLDSKDATVAELQKKIADYEQSETDRIANETKQKEYSEFVEKANPIFGELGIKNNKYIRDGLLADAKAKMAEDSTLGLKDILSTLTKDIDDIKDNPQQTVVIPGVGNGIKGEVDITKMNYDEYKAYRQTQK